MLANPAHPTQKHITVWDQQGALVTKQHLKKMASVYLALLEGCVLEAKLLEIKQGIKQSTIYLFPSF